MNLKEIHIINSLIELTLIKHEIEGLKERLITLVNYNDFLEGLLGIIIGKDKSITLLDFLTNNSLSDKFLFIQNKKVDVIEELAELHFKELISDNTIFLLQSNDETFLNHLAFLRETEGAFIINERVDLKKKLEKLGKLNEFNLSENDIKLAITIAERKRLKEHLVKIQPTKIKETKIIAFNFKTALKYAAIIILVVGPAIFIVNRINNSKHTNTTGLADNQIKKVIDTLKPDNIKYKFKFPETEKFIGTNVLLSERKFGFSSSDDEKISIEINNISSQLNALELELKKTQTDTTNTYYLKQSIDSLNSIKETYTFDEKEVKIYLYSTQLKADKKTLNAIKAVILEHENKKVVYLKIKNSFYKLLNTGKYHKLMPELNEDINDNLKTIESQND